MNYEGLYNEYQVLEKRMKDKTNGVQKLHKMIAKEVENGDLENFRRDIAFLESAVAEEARVLSAMKELEAGFNSRECLGDGEPVAQTLRAYEELGMGMKGELPAYEISPYRVKIGAENQDLYLDRKKVQCMCLKNFVRQVKAGQDKLMKASFNVLTFTNGLADVYDLALLKLKRQPEVDIYLTNLYKFLASVGRFHRDCGQQSYALDLARLYDSGIKEIKDRRRIQFGPNREGNKAVRTLDSQGREEYLSAVRSFR